MPPKQKVIILGWDAADWKVIFPLIDQGKMPNMKILLEKGVHGKIKTLDPPLSPMLWTSIATGVRADKHGISGFIEPTPDGERLRPVTSTSRKVKAIWNILNQEGFKSNVVAWWPTNPVEPINGVMVSNLFQIASKSIEEPWISPPESVHPKEMEETLEKFRVHPHEITLSMALPFIPNLNSDKELRKEQRTLSVLKTLANAATVHAISTYLHEETTWDFMAIYHDAIDHFSHIAMRYHPPKRPEIEQKEFDDYNLVVEAAYRFHDLMLGRVLELMNEQTTLLIVSDHGFHSDHQRPLYIPREPSGPAVEHSPYGIFAMAGPGIKKDGVEVSGASILDITPTLLHYLNLPVGEDMEGKILHACFEEMKEVKTIPSWENVYGNSGMHDKNRQEDPWDAIEALQQLVEMGYIDAPDDDKLKEVEKAKRENLYYLARNMINGGRTQEAMVILEDIYAESKVIRYGQRLAFTQLALRQYQKAFQLLEELKELHLKQKKEKLQKSDDPFGSNDMEEPMYLQYLEGLILLAINRPRLALPILESVQKKNPNNFHVAFNIAQIHNQRKNYAAAEKQFICALAIDDGNGKAHHGLGFSFLRRNLIDQAIEEFLLAISHDFYLPNAHYHLGESLMKQAQYDDAAYAFEVAVRLSPGMTKAHKWLYEIYTEFSPNAIMAEKTMDFLTNNIQGELTICTGIDGSNMKSAFAWFKKIGIPSEWSSKTIEEAKVLASNTLWLKDKKNEIIYMPCHCLSFLPTSLNYRLIVIEDENKNIIDALKKSHKMPFKEKELPLELLSKIKQDQNKIDSWIASQAKLPLLILHNKNLQLAHEEQVEILLNFISLEK